MSNLLTVAEAAQRLRLHPMTVHKKIRRGEIPAIQVGGKYLPIRIDERELRAWLYSDPEPEPEQ
jgi:excisionase family DNA binding protein